MCSRRSPWNGSRIVLMNWKEQAAIVAHTRSSPFATALTRSLHERHEAAARTSRYGHRDAIMILIGYRHGLRASELSDLQWSQVELATGRLHVRRAKNGSPSAMQGDEIRALRRLQREQG